MPRWDDALKGDETLYLPFIRRFAQNGRSEKGRDDKKCIRVKQLIEKGWLINTIYLISVSAINAYLYLCIKYACMHVYTNIIR